MVDQMLFELLCQLGAQNLQIVNLFYGFAANFTNFLINIAR